MMASQNENPMASQAGFGSTVQKRDILMAGIACDVYGLEELSARPDSAVSCLWLHHPRGRSKEDMAVFAQHIVGSWEQRRQGLQGAGARRALIAVVYDQRNHGGRLVDQRANGAWRGGNQAHAVDMFGAIRGMVSDNDVLIDLVEGYVRMEVEGSPGQESTEWTGSVDQHLVLGVSLGGHSTWQSLFAEDRVTGGVVVIGCPDYMALLSNRAKLSKLATFKAEDEGSSFLGSRHFPADLVRACLKYDPKAMLFGTGAVQDPSSAEEQQRLTAILDARVGGKKILLCSGGADKLVPYAMSKPFVDFFEKALKTWYSGRDATLVNKVYDGIGHEFSSAMVQDATSFLLDEVAAAPAAVHRSSTFGEEGKSKI